MKTETSMLVAGAAFIACAMLIGSSNYDNNCIAEKAPREHVEPMEAMPVPASPAPVLEVEEEDDPNDVDPLIYAQEIKSDWFTDEYLALNTAIKDYADIHGSIDFHGTYIDGLAVMAQANCESAYMCDASKTLTALYPSVFVDIDSVEDVYALDITKVWGDGSSLNGTYLSKPYWTEKAGPYYAWSSGEGVYEQGPLQQRVTPTSVSALGDTVSEYEKLASSGVLSTCSNTLYGYEATSLCTGTEYLEYSLGYETTGDRWSIKDNCTIWKADKEGILEDLWNVYYADCGYTPNKYEYLAILSYAHWIPSVVCGNMPAETAQYYGFSYDGAWFDLAHQLSSEQAINIIRQHVRANIDENRQLHYDGTHSKEQAMQVFSLALHAGSTTNASDSEPWQIFNELVAAGCVDSSTVLTNPDYGYQHAMKYAIQYLYAYEMLNVLLIENY